MLDQLAPESVCIAGATPQAVLPRDHPETVALKAPERVLRVKGLPRRPKLLQESAQGGVDLAVHGTSRSSPRNSRPRVRSTSRGLWGALSPRRRQTLRFSKRSRILYCEAILSAHRVANSQWTPLREDVPNWEALGFELFERLEPFSPLEVFPTATYRMLRGDQDLRLDIHFADFAPGPKDMLDAIIAAVTVREYDAGHGEALGWR